MRFDKSILHLPWYKLYLSYVQRATTRRLSQVMSLTSKTFKQLFLKREPREFLLREFLREFLNCDTCQLFFCSEGHNFEVETEAYTKLRFSSSTKPCSFTKTCCFGTYLEPGSIFGASVSSFTKTHSFTKTSSFGTSNLYWTRKHRWCFGSILRPLRTLTSSASSLQRLLSGGHLVRSCTLTASVLLWLWTSSRKNICNQAYFIWTGFTIVIFPFGSRNATRSIIEDSIGLPVEHFIRK
jgi:hypothetical protein